MTELFANIGMSVVVDLIAGLSTIIIMAFVAWLLSGSIRNLVRSLRYLSRTRQAGVSNFFTKRSEYNKYRMADSLDKYVAKTTQNFTYVGHYFSQATDISRLDKAILDLVRRGCTVSIILLDGDVGDQEMTWLERYLAITPGTLLARLHHAFGHFSKLQDTLGADERQRFLVKRHRALLTCSAFLFDIGVDGREGILVDYKIGFVGRDKSFGIELAPRSGGAHLYSNLRDSFIAVVAEAI
jgi:hypothetical protein